MKIALIAGGQPRFTQEFLVLLSQLQGFDQADLYFSFWNTSWATDAADGARKIRAILPEKYQLVKLQLLDQPSYELPPHKLNHPPESYPNVHWAYKRRLGMWLSTQMALNLIDQEYDAILKVRPDGMLDRNLHIDQLDLVNNELIYPAGPLHGIPGHEICDQFVVGTHAGLKFYAEMADNFQRYVPEFCPRWEEDIHIWASEHILGHHLAVNNKQQVRGDFYHILAGTSASITRGRSQYTDNHFHHPIILGPTETI
jgi:hypothetical protein